MRAIALLSLSFISSVSCICYYPDGGVSNQDVPCTDGANSTCCGQGYACLSNLICMLTAATPSPVGVTGYVRGSCTDQSWESDSCPLFCITQQSPNVNDFIGYGAVAKCSDRTDDSYYCFDGAINATSCINGTNLIQFPGQPSVVTTIGLTASSSSTSASSTSISIPSMSTFNTSTSSTTLASATAALSTVTMFTRHGTRVYASFVVSPSASQSDSSPFPTTASAPDDSSANISEDSLGAPIGVGVGVAAIFISVLAFYLYYRRGNKHQAKPYGKSTPEQDSPAELMGSPPLKYGLYEYPQQYQSVAAHEMLAEELAHELESRSRDPMANSSLRT